MTVYYIDATQGSDSNDGFSATTAFKSFSKVESLLKAGDTINLDRGEVWYDELNFAVSDITVQAYGTGANPLINGGGTRCGVIAQGENALIQNIDVTNAINGLYVTGANASATIVGGSYTANGTGIVAGGDGRLILVDGAVCTGSKTSLGAGDGIQISADASGGLHTFVNVTCTNNAIAGINAKAGTVTVSESTLSFNGGCGWIAQNAIDVFKVLGSRIEGNNQSDLGVGQASIEDSAIVYSTGNLYLDPNNGRLGTVQINIVESAGWAPEPRDRPVALYSSGDTFVYTSGQTTTIGSIRVNTNDKETIVSIQDATFDHAAGSGIAIDAYGATNLDLHIADSTFNMVNTRAVRVNAAADFGTDLATNVFNRTDGGMVFEIQDTEYYSVATLPDLFTKYNVPGTPQPEEPPAPVPEPSNPPQIDPANQAPVDITLSAAAVIENKAGAEIGTITVTDPDEKWGFVFSVSDPRFQVVGSPYRLELKDGVSLDFETEATVKLSVTATDSGGLSKTQDFVIHVVDAPGVTIIGSQWMDQIDGGSTVIGNPFATPENDTIHGNGGADIIRGLAGNDLITGDEGNDILSGDAGNDILVGGGGTDELRGGDGNDVLVIADNKDIYDLLNGGNGTDTVLVNGTSALTRAGFNATEASIEVWQGNDKAILGTAADDRFDFSGLSAMSGVSRIDGGDGNDVLVGSRFADYLVGGRGHDRIEGGAGNDILTGGAGHDVFVFKAGFGRDVITDYKPTGNSADTIEFAKDVFASYQGVMAASKQVGSDVVITTALGDTLTLPGVSLTNLSVDDFRFV